MSQFNFVVKVTTDYLDKSLHTGVKRPVYSSDDLVKLLACLRSGLDGGQWDTVDVLKVYPNAPTFRAITSETRREDRLAFLKFIHFELLEECKNKTGTVILKNPDSVFKLIEAEIESTINELKEQKDEQNVRTNSKEMGQEVSSHGPHSIPEKKGLHDRREGDSISSESKTQRLRPADRIALETFKVSRDLGSPLRHGFFLIMGKSGSGKTKMMSGLNALAVKLDYTSDGIIFASEPDHRSVGRGIDALLSIIGKKPIAFIDSIRDIIYLQDNLVSGGISAQLFDIVTTLASYCMRCGVTCVAAINPTVDDSRVYDSLFHMLKSSSTGVFDTTKNLGSYRSLVTDVNGSQYYERVETDSVLQMLGYPNGTTLTMPTEEVISGIINVVPSERPRPTLLFLGA